MFFQKHCGWAVGALDRAAGRRPAGEAPPPPYIVTAAVMHLSAHGVLHYCEALLAAGRLLPRMAAGSDPDVFEATLRRLAAHDVDGWWSGVVSGKGVTVSKVITDAFVQRAGGDPNVVLPVEARAPKPIVAAEGRVRIVEEATGQPIVQQAIARDDDAPVEIVGGAGSVHRETIKLSKWEVVGGWGRAGGAPPRSNTRPAGPVGAAARLGLPTTRKSNP
jgi:hypothetical protein